MQQAGSTLLASCRAGRQADTTAFTSTPIRPSAMGKNPCRVSPSLSLSLSLCCLWRGTNKLSVTNDKPDCYPAGQADAPIYLWRHLSQPLCAGRAPLGRPCHAMPRHPHKNSECVLRASIHRWMGWHLTEVSSRLAPYEGAACVTAAGWWGLERSCRLRHGSSEMGQKS